MTDTRPTMTDDKTPEITNNNSIVQLGPFPPKGSTLYFTMLPFLLMKDEVAWNMTARTGPEGSGVTVMSLTGRDPIALAHIMFGLCHVFGLNKAQEFPTFAVAEQYTKAGLPNPHIHMDMLTRDAPNNWDAPRPMRYGPEDLEQFLGYLNAYLDDAAAAAARSLVDHLPESMKVGPHPETGEYKPACGARLYGSGPVITAECIEGGPCDITESGRCWRWRGTETIEAPAITLDAPKAPTVALDAPKMAVEELVDATIVSEPEKVPVAAPEAEKAPVKTAARKSPTKKKKTTRKAPATPK